MNSQSALSNLTFPVKESYAHNNVLVLKKIRFYNCAIIYLHDAQLLVKTKDGQSFNVPPESLCYVEKNTVIDVALKVLKDIDEIGICRLTSNDVVRHPLVQRIVQAYDVYEQKYTNTRKQNRRHDERR